jgi:IclR family KDG regulon transcriptional repressor
MNSTEKVLWLLKRLGEPPYSLTLTALADELGCGRSGVYKLLQALTKDGFVTQNPETKKYGLGPAVYRLGAIYRDLRGISEVAQPVMRKLADLTGETVSIGIRDDDSAILFAKIESPHAVRLLGKLGQRYPLNAGAIGKLLAAFHDPARIEELFDHMPLIKKTANTITDRVQLLNEYEKIRRQGYAHSDEENAPGAFGISAPIYERDGKVSACICIAGPKERFTTERVCEWTRAVIAAADQISQILAGKAGG